MTDSRRHSRTLRSFFLLLLCIASQQLFAQSQFVISNVDTSRYPTIKANLMAIDSSGTPITLTQSDVRVFEDGMERPVTLFSCPEPPPPQPASVALSIDISTSMLQSLQGMTALGGAKLSCIELVKAIAMPPTDVAVLTCDDKAYINQDLTTSRPNVLNAISGIREGGGNDFVTQLLDARAGLMTIPQAGTGRRYAVLLTDGYWNPLDTAVLSRCIEICTQYQIRFYAVIYSPAEKNPAAFVLSLRKLATATGGMVIEGVITPQQAKEAARQLQVAIDGIDPCRIEWVSRGGCVTYRTARISVMRLGLQSDVTYPIPSSSFSDSAQLVVAPSVINYGSTLPGTTRDTTVDITAINRPVTIYGIVNDNPYFSITQGAVVSPITLLKGSTYRFTIRFSPIDSAEQFDRIAIITDACQLAEVNVSGGFHQRGNIGLRITTPNGGEELTAGTDSVLTWAGINASEPVRLEYSTDAGATWLLIKENATGLRYPWHVPATPSRQCLARVSLMYHSPLLKSIENGNGPVGEVDESRDGRLTLTVDKDSIHIWQTGTLTPVTGMFHRFVQSARILPDNNTVVSVGGDGIVRLWNAWTGASIASMGANGTPLNSVRYSRDGRYLITGGNRINTNPTLYLWDVNTRRLIRAMDSNNTFDINYRSAAFNAAGTMVVAGGNSRTVPVFDVTTGRSIRTLAYPGNVSAISFSRDGSTFLIGGDAGVTVWDASTFTLQNTIPTGPVTWADFSGDGSTVAVTGKNSVDLWELYTGTFVRSLNGHTQPTRCVRYSFDERRLVSSSNDGSAIIWDMQDAILPSDVSDSLWAIVSSSVAANDVDLGRVVIGKFRDSIVTAFIRNTGNTALSVRDMRLYGGQFTDFAVLSGQAPFIIAPGEAHAVEFRFTPGATGLRQATVALYLPDSILRVSLIGEGVAPILQINPTVVDFGAVEISRSKDSIVIMAVRNVSDVPVIIDSTVLLGPGADRFQIIEGGGSFTLLPDSGRTLHLRFTPNTTGRIGAYIAFHYNNIGSPVFLQLFGEGVTDLRPIIQGPTAVSLHALTCRPDTTVADIKLHNRGAGALDISSIEITGQNADDFSLSTPFTPVSIAPSQDWNIQVQFHPSASGSRAAQLLIHSNAEESPFTISLQGQGDGVILSTSVHTIDLGELCPDQAVDTVIAITNSGTIATIVMGMADWPITLEQTSWRVDSGGTAIVRIHTVSSTEGPFNAIIRFTDSLCGTVALVEVTGRIERPRITAPAMTIIAPKGSVADSILLLTNQSTREVIIVDGALDDSRFEVVAGQLPLTLSAGATASLRLRFAPSDDTPVSTILHLSGTPCLAADIAVTGVSTPPIAATLILPDLHAWPGDTVLVAIRLRNGKVLQQRGITAIKTTLRLNSTLLLPVTPTSVGTHDSLDLVIPLTLPVATDRDSVVARLRFVAVLGNDTTSPLVLESPEPIGGSAEVRAVPGSFTLNQICGLSSRLMEVISATVLKQVTPNPASTSITVTFGAPAGESAEIFLTDLYGRRVAQVFNGTTSDDEQQVEFSTSQLSSGVYYCTLRTPWRTISRMVMVRK